jgi:M6 family metalloprotease-like protein
VRVAAGRRMVVGASAVALLAGGVGAAGAVSRPAAAGHPLSFPAFAVSMTSDAVTGLHAGETFHVSGVVRSRDVRTGALGHVAPARVSLRLHDATGRLGRDLGTVTTDAQGRFMTTVPGTATAGYVAPAPLGSSSTLAVDATRVDGLGGGSAHAAGSAAVPVTATAKGLRVEDAFVSSVGWVTPGKTYPFLVRVINPSAKKHTRIKVTIASVSGMKIRRAHVLHGNRLPVHNGVLTWRLRSIAAGTTAKPTTKTLVVTGRANSYRQDPKVVWKNIATTAHLRYDGHVHRAATSHGPRVIPPDDTFASARFGDRPFPVVPVDYADFQHDADHPATKLDGVINGRSNRGSTFNLYQEMSLRQLFPHADIPSARIATSDYKASDNQTFTKIDPATVNSCHGVTLAQTGNQAIEGQPRITNGWYQLPGQRDYYGDDANGSAVVGAEAGVGQLQAIDSGCGPTAKLAYDAAVAADPDINYSDFDTDKDGVVDFFEVIFEGLGGNGDSQINGKPPYDNVWPHSSSLLDSYVDQATGLTGYISHDQLRNLEGHPMWYVDSSRTTMTTTNKGPNLKVFVRVGPYNVNPETAIDHASVISHEYGHSLGAPDYYSTGSRATYGDYMLMATDKSQNVSAFQLQDWGWVVPQPISKGTTKVKGWRDTKHDTHTIHWRTPAGKPYTLRGKRVHNARVYTAKLPGRRIIDPAKVRKGATAKHVWWSGSGNDFGCGPNHAHNLDISLPELRRLQPGTKVTLSFDSAWEIEWDYDYGFVQVGLNDNQTGKMNYSAVASQNNYTTPSTTNPNQSQCQAKYGNGLTGSSTSWKNNTQEVDRRGVGDATGVSRFDSYPDFTFAKDSYDISALAGKSGVVRFSYATDPGLAKAGWFIDDVKVTAKGKTLWSSNFEKSGGTNDSHIFNGGCRQNLKVADACTHGWSYLNVGRAAPLDHGYYLSMRDRSGFDSDGHGQNDRDAIGFRSGLLLEYTDESHGYGNVGTDDPPAQSPLDSHPTPGDDTPNLNDATFVRGEHFSDQHWVDNYKDPSSKSGNWELNYGCLGFKVTKMSGTDVGPRFARPGQGGNLTGNVTFTRSKHCAPFNYGYPKVSRNHRPVVKIEVKPGRPTVGKRVTFNGSQSTDDRTASSRLRYRWDFDNDGQTDATGATVRHRFHHKGRHRVRLTVVDAGGLKASKSVTVRVQGRSAAAAASVRLAAPTASVSNLLPGTLGCLAFLALMAAFGAARHQRTTTLSPGWR